MGQVTVSVNGRSYRLVCGDGEETRVKELAALLSAKVDALVAQLGQPGEARLLVMAGLLLADELIDTRAKLDDALAEAASALRDTIAAVTPHATFEPEPQPESQPQPEPEPATQTAPDPARKPRIELPGKKKATG